jgi:pimeloyl-ACP methyl ester carboxylesterase
MGRGSRPEQPDELRALARLAFSELARAPGGIGGVHHAIAGRVFGVTGTPSAPVRMAHDAISSAVYAGLRAGAELAGRGTDLALARRPEPAGPRLSTTPLGAAVIGAVTGLRGDSLELERSALCEPMCVRVEGEPLTLDPPAVAAAFPQASGRLAVFLHGLMETEFAWRRGSRGSGGTYGSRLESQTGLTPVWVRYNSGRRISENGCSLSGLLERLVDAWPVEVTELALIGHSMGGLVVRSACHVGAAQRAAWVPLVRHSVSLGSPHMGAPLERGVHVLSAGLAAVPETRPLANFLRRRSGGIRDLRHGSLSDEDWRGLDPDALRAAACQEVPLLEGATHYFVSATITRSAAHPLGRLLGDSLVLVPSATGRSRTRRIPFQAEHGLHVGEATHLALLNHPAVYQKLREWLAPAVPAPA